MPHTFYIAGRYSRRSEFARYAKIIERTAPGTKSCAKWLDGLHEQGDGNILNNEDLASEMAQMDLDDIDKADVLILSTEEITAPRGGRLVEFGYALGLYQGRSEIGEGTALDRTPHVVVIGPMENIFCFLGERIFPTWDEYFTWIAEAYPRMNRIW